jgi:hypothetical protein
LLLSHVHERNKQWELISRMNWNSPLNISLRTAFMNRNLRVQRSGTNLSQCNHSTVVDTVQEAIRALIIVYVNGEISERHYGL